MEIVPSLKVMPRPHPTPMRFGGTGQTQAEGHPGASQVGEPPFPPPAPAMCTSAPAVSFRVADGEKHVQPHPRRLRAEFQFQFLVSDKGERPRADPGSCSPNVRGAGGTPPRSQACSASSEVLAAQDPDNSTQGSTAARAISPGDAPPRSGLFRGKHPCSCAPGRAVLLHFMISLARPRCPLLGCFLDDMII